MNIDEYIQDKQKVIDEFLKYEKESGYCYVNKITIENALGISKNSLNNKIRKINELDNVIEKINDDKYYIAIKDFKKTIHVKNIHIVDEHFLKNDEDLHKNQKMIATKLGVREKDIQRVKGIVYGNAGMKLKKLRSEMSENNHKNLNKEPKWKKIIKEKNKRKNIQSQNMKVKNKTR